MEPIYRILGKRGRTTIPYALRLPLGFRQNDLLSFRRDGDVVIVKREKICDHCSAVDRNDSPVSPTVLHEFLDSLPPNARKEALVYLASRAN